MLQCKVTLQTLFNVTLHDIIFQPGDPSQKNTRRKVFIMATVVPEGLIRGPNKTMYTNYNVYKPPVNMSKCS